MASTVIWTTVRASHVSARLYSLLTTMASAFPMDEVCTRSVEASDLALTPFDSFDRFLAQAKVQIGTTRTLTHTCVRVLTAPK